MLRTLLESRPARRRRTGGIAVSILLHAGIIGVAATATAREVTRSADPDRRELHISKLREMPNSPRPSSLSFDTYRPR